MLTTEKPSKLCNNQSEMKQQPNVKLSLPRKLIPRGGVPNLAKSDCEKMTQVIINEQGSDKDMSVYCFILFYALADNT